MKIFRPEERIHIIDNEATVEETIKDIVGTNVIIIYFVTL